MSAWHLAVQHLYAARGYEATTPAIGTDTRGLREAARLGLVQQIERERVCHWKLTSLGVEFAEGRVTTGWRRPGGLYWMATWLRALPKMSHTA